MKKEIKRYTITKTYEEIYDKIEIFPAFTNRLSTEKGKILHIADCTYLNFIKTHTDLVFIIEGFLVNLTLRQNKDEKNNDFLNRIQSILQINQESLVERTGYSGWYNKSKYSCYLEGYIFKEINSQRCDGQ